MQLLLGRIGALEERRGRIDVREPHHEEDEQDDAEQQRDEKGDAAGQDSDDRGHVVRLPTVLPAGLVG